MENSGVVYMLKVSFLFLNSFFESMTLRYFYVDRTSGRLEENV